VIVPLEVMLCVKKPFSVAANVVPSHPNGWANVLTAAPGIAWWRSNSQRLPLPVVDALR